MPCRCASLQSLSGLMVKNSAVARWEAGSGGRGIEKGFVVNRRLSSLWLRSRCFIRWTFHAKADSLCWRCVNYDHFRNRTNARLTSGLHGARRLLDRGGGGSAHRHVLAVCVRSAAFGSFAGVSTLGHRISILTRTLDRSFRHSVFFAKCGGGVGFGSVNLIFRKVTIRPSMRRLLRPIIPPPKEQCELIWCVLVAFDLCLELMITRNKTHR